MHTHHSPNSHRRSSERVAMPLAEIPVYFETVFDGVEVSLLVENLSAGGGLLMCPDICESLEINQCLRNGVLVLPGGNPRLDAIVRWQLWPRVGVQFDNISQHAAAQISQ